MARSRQEGGSARFLWAESEVTVQGRHQGVDQLAQLSGGDLGTLCYVGGGKGDEVDCRDQGLVERGQQVVELGGVEVGQHMQQVRHGSWGGPGSFSGRSGSAERHAQAGGRRYYHEAGLQPRRPDRQPTV